MEKEQLVYNRLIEVACEGKVVPLCEVASLLELDIECSSGREKIFRVLCDIAYQENAAGRPMLTAVAVLPEIGYPSMDFFLLARELGVTTSIDSRSFYTCELKRVHDYWKQHIPASETFRLMVEYLHGNSRQANK